MNKKTLWGKLACALVALTLVWGGVTGCKQQPPAPNTFTITFDSNGGSDVKAITKEEGAVVEAPIAPTKTGYNFVEWQKEDGTAYDWTAPLTASVKLKAKWDVVTYSITYLPKGVESKNPTTYTIETETITLEDPTNVPDATKPNFVGWYEDEACTIAATGIEKGSTGDKTFYAKYTDKAVYTVKFILDGKEFGKAQKVEEGKTVTAIEGYDMYSDKELTKAFDIKTEIKAETTIYLKAKEFTVTFDSDGGSAVAAAKVKYNETVKEPTAPTKKGFNFDGWYNGDTKFDFTTKITKDLTLKAKWKAEEVETPLATLFDFNKEYSGYLEWDMVENGTYGNSTTKDPIYLNLNVKDVALKSKDEIVVEFKLTSTEGLQHIGYQSAVDNYKWATVMPNETNTYKVSLTIGDKTTFENDCLGFFFTPQGLDASLVGKKYKLNFESIKATLKPYVAGEKVTEVLVNEKFENYVTQIKVSKLQEILDSSTGEAEIVFTYKITDATTLTNDWEWVAKFLVWPYDNDGKETWPDAKELDGDGLFFDTQSDLANLDISKTLTKSFKLSDFIPCFDGYHTISFNIFGPAEFTKAEVIYTKK